VTATLHHRERSRTVDFGRSLLADLNQLLPAEFDSLFAITTERLASQVTEVTRTLGPRHAPTRIGAGMHVPVPDVESVVEEFDAIGARAVLAIGGGSAVGLGKPRIRRCPTRSRNSLPAG
jgi:alcohol dehydrogenase class IV